jgi:tetratricopeptide (TPR) repeat protein
MKPSWHLTKIRNLASAYFLLLVVFIPFGNLAAQNDSSSFDEIAAEATAARDVEDAPRAIGLYTQALQLNAKWEDGWWSLGLLQYGSGEYASAIDAFSHLLALVPTAAPALALRGLCEFEMGDYPKSLADIQKGLASGAAGDARQEQILRYHRAMLLTRLGRFPDALQAYSPFAEHNLSSPELLVGIGLAGLRIPLLPKDARADQQALLTAVGDATFKFMQGDQTAAKQAFSDLFQKFPAAQNTHFLYGNLLLAFGPDAAVPQFKKELETAPDNMSALSMLAWSLLMQRQPDKALPYARRLAKAEPEQAASQLILGRSLLETGNAVAGIEYLQRALKLDPRSLEIHIALAKAFSESGRNDDARRERMLCLQMTQNGATGLAHP